MPVVDHPTELWAAWFQRRDRRVRDDLMAHYQPLVASVVRNMPRPSHVDAGDLSQAGQFGLLEAIDEFDPLRGQFEARATFLIRKRIRDEMRRGDWLTRTDRAAVRRLQRSEEQLTARLHRAPTEQELVAAMDCSVERLREVRRLALGVHLDDTIESEAPGEDVHEAAMVAEQKNRIVEALAGLRGREGVVMRLYYLEGKTMPEIGRLLGISPSMVSKIHTRAVRQVHQHLV